jgi:hypothetical protein
MGESELRSEDSLQSVKYLGKIPTSHAHGIGIAIVSYHFYSLKNSFYFFHKEPVRILWKRSRRGLFYNRCALSIHPFGLCIYEEIASGTYKSVWYDSIENISYCVAEPYRHRIFAWIARSQYTNELECHVVLCQTRRQAHFLAELLAKKFYQSYNHRQEQNHPPTSSNCSVCDTMTRQQQQRQSNNRLSLIENNDKQIMDDYEHITYRGPMIARAFVRGYGENSMNSSTRRSITLTDEDSIRPMEYYRR